MSTTNTSSTLLPSKRAAAAAPAKEAALQERKRMRRSLTSLPATIDSTTSVNPSKVERRRSLRRQSLQHKKSTSLLGDDDDNEENNHSPNVKQGPTPYWKVLKERGGERTPPQTRSAKKKKQRGNRLPPRHNDDNNSQLRPGVLTFSPPNQARNKLIAKAEAHAKVAARNERIKKRRDKGNLLIFSPSNREGANALPDGIESDEEFYDDETASNQNTVNADTKGQTRNVQYDNASDSESELTSTTNHNNNNAEMSDGLKSMRQSLADLTETTKMQWSTQLTEERARCARLEESVSNLKDEKEKIQIELNEEQKNHLIQNEKRLAEQVRLEEQHKADRRECELKIERLEQVQADLEGQIASANKVKDEYAQELTALREKQAELTSEMEKTKAELLRITTEYEETKSAMGTQQGELTEDNFQLRQQLDSLEKENQDFQAKITEYEKAIDRYENEVSPSLANAYKDIQEREKLIDELKQTIQELKDELASVEAAKNEIENQREEDRIDFQQINESSSKALQKIQAQDAEKDAKIGELFRQLGDAKLELEAQQDETARMQEEFSQERSAFESKVQNLEQALEESMSHLESADQMRYELESTIEGLRQEAGQQESAKHESHSELAMARQRESQLRDENKEMRAKLAQLENTVASKETEIHNLREYADNHGAREEELSRRLQSSDEVRRELHARVMQLMGNIRVFVRVRPHLGGEAASSPNGDEALIQFPGHHQNVGKENASANKSSADDLTKRLIQVTEPKKDRGGLSDRRKQWRYGFDEVFHPESSQNEVWRATEPLVQSAIDGYNVTIFAYGQTGSGKTYTLLGDGATCRGIVGESIAKLFHNKLEIESISEGKSHMSMSVEMLEVYNEEVRDLLAPAKGKPIKVEVNSKEVIGNQVIDVLNMEDVMKVLQEAQNRRCVKATSSNAKSSRSHLLFTLNIAVTMEGGKQRIGKLNICDLAGSERLDKSGTNVVGGSLLEESKAINKSLSTLSNVIEKLQANSEQVPFRESKLTWLLKNSLSGNSKTLAIVCCSPDPSHHHETLCSLRFAEKVNKVELKKSVAKFSC